MTDSTELTLPERAALALGTAKHEQELIELAQQSKSITEIKNKDAREQCHSTAMVLKTRRTSIRKAGKDARDDATKFSKAVIAEEDRLVALIEPDETRLIGLRDAWDAERETERQAKLAAEKRRVDAIRVLIDDFRNTPAQMVGKSSQQIGVCADHLSETVVALTAFHEFTEEARAERDHAVKVLREMQAKQLAAEEAAAEAARHAEADRIERKRAAEANRVEAQRLADLAAQMERDAQLAHDKQALADRLAREQREAEEARLRAEREAHEAELRQQREAAEAELQRQREELARQQAEIAVAKAEQERVERERLAAIEAEAQARREAEEAEAARIAQAEADRIFVEDEAQRVAAKAAEAERQAQLMAAMPRIVPAEPVEMVSITKKEYEMLRADSEFLQCLQNAGVDNWDGYDYACELHNELRAA